MDTHWSQFVPNMSTRHPRTLSSTSSSACQLNQSPGEIKRREEVLDPQVSPEEIKSREVELGYRESWTSFASFVSQLRSYGHCLCDSVPHSSCDSNCVVQWSLRNAERTLPQLTFCCSGGGPRQPRSSGLAPVSVFTLLFPPPPLSPSLIGHLASVDV